jgi:hypothetical protein
MADVVLAEVPSTPSVVLADANAPPENTQIVPERPVGGVGMSVTVVVPVLLQGPQPPTLHACT